MQKITLWKVTENKNCAICGYAMTLNNCNIDHIRPVSKGGTNDRNNLQLTHIYCNWLKGDVIDFRIPIDLKLPEIFPNSLKKSRKKKRKKRKKQSITFTTKRLSEIWHEIEDEKKKNLNQYYENHA